jgi:hypothetical protein
MSVNPNKTFYSTFKQSPLNYIFNEEVLKIIYYYTNNITDKFNASIIKYTQLQKSFSTYSSVTELSIEKQLVDLLRNNMSSIDDLKQQINNLEISLNECMNKNSTLYQKKFNSLVDKQLTQDASIKLEYLQYLIMFDISASNGLFLPAQLDIAIDALKNNGGKLNYNINQIKTNSESSFNTITI